MNKDIVLTRFWFEEEGTDFEILNAEDQKVAVRLERWLSDRNAAKYRNRIKEILKSMGCDRPSEFCKLTHCLSLNDTLWVKEDMDNISWNDVNLYTNEFSDIIANSAFSHYGLDNVGMYSTSPEWTTNGQFSKCWKRRDYGIVMLKGGVNESRISPYCEVLASEIFCRLDKRSVIYSLEYINESPVSVSKLFTSESIGLLPYYYLIGEGMRIPNLLDIHKEYSKYGYDDMFAAMIVGDCITLNVDRHFGNFGWYMLNETFERKTMAPLYDFNLCFLPFLDSLSGLDTVYSRYNPVIGTDWVRAAQTMLTDHIKAEIINLKDLVLECPIDDIFTKERLEQINIIKNVQIDRILGRDKSFRI